MMKGSMEDRAGGMTVHVGPKEGDGGESYPLMVFLVFAAVSPR